MAIDTQRKRASVIAITHYASSPSVVPDGSFSQGDKQTSGYGYYGITAAGGVVSASTRSSPARRKLLLLGV